MFTDYLVYKMLIVILVLIILLLGFHYSFKFFKMSIKKEEIEHEIDEFAYHYNQLEEKKKMEREYLEKLEEIKNNISKLEKKYEDGVFLKNNIKIWQTTRNLFEDLNRWKKKPFPIDESEVNYFLEDFEPVFKELGVELIKPKVGEIFDMSKMKVIKTYPDIRKQNGEIVEVIKFGYNLKLKNRTKVLEVAEVAVIKN